MNLSKLVRVIGLCLMLSFTAMSAFAARPCGCNFCTQAGPDQACNLDGTTTTCGYFLAVALCPAG